MIIVKRRETMAINETDILGGKAIMSKTGHSLIKTKMKETKAL